MEEQSNINKSSNNDKWIMFKNYMHNELGITRDDIRHWIEESVQKEAERLVSNEFNKFDVRKVVQDVVTDDRFFGSKNLKRDIADELAKLIMARIHLV